MSEASKCDRCGAFYVADDNARVVCEYYPDSTARTKNCGDMCPKCAAKFDKWWNKKRKAVSRL